MTNPGRGQQSYRVRRIGRLDIPGGGHFVGRMKPPHGTSIIAFDWP